MAWASVGTLGTGTSKTSSSTLSFTASAAAEVGNVIVVVTAWDNTDTTDGNTTRLSCSDSAGNTYTKAREFTNAQGAADAGVTAALFYTKVSTQLPSAGSISVTSNTAKTAKAAAAWEFTIGAGNVLTLEAGTDRADDNANPGLLSLSALDNIEHLFLRAVGREATPADAYTPSADFTSQGKAGTSGGGAETNMSVASEFRIFSATSQSNDPSWTNADHASVFVALKEASGAAVQSLTGNAILDSVPDLFSVGSALQQNLSGNVLLDSLPDLFSAGQLPILGNVLLDSVPDLFASGQLPILGDVLLDSTPSLETAGQLPILGNVLLDSTPSLEATGQLPILGDALLDSVPDLFASGQLPILGDGFLDSTPSLEAAGSLQFKLTGDVVLDSTPSLEAAGQLPILGNALLDSIPDLFTSGIIGRPVFQTDAFQSDFVQILAVSNELTGNVVLDSVPDLFNGSLTQRIFDDILLCSPTKLYEEQGVIGDAVFQGILLDSTPDLFSAGNVPIVGNTLLDSIPDLFSAGNSTLGGAQSVTGNVLLDSTPSLESLGQLPLVGDAALGSTPDFFIGKVLGQKPQYIVARYQLDISGTPVIVPSGSLSTITNTLTGDRDLSVTFNIPTDGKFTLIPDRNIIGTKRLERPSQCAPLGEVVSDLFF